MNQSVQTAQSVQSDTMYVHAYNITRSLTSFQKFNVVAVDRKGELLATVAVDMNFEDAAIMTEALNISSSAEEALNGNTGEVTEAAKDAE